MRGVFLGGVERLIFGVELGHPLVVGHADSPGYQVGADARRDRSF